MSRIPTTRSRSILLLILMGWLISVGISLLFMRLDILSSPTGFFIQSIILESIFILPLLFVLWRNGQLHRNTFRLNRLPASLLSGIVILSAGIAILFDAIDRILRMMIMIPEEYYQLDEKLTAQTPLEWLLVILAIGIIGPFAEELIFRGAYLKAAETDSGSWHWAVSATTIVFALIHGLPFLYFQILLIGIIFSLLTVGFNSVYPALILHIFINIQSILLINASEKILSFYEKSGTIRPLVIMLGGIFTYIGLRLTAKMFRLPQNGFHEAKPDNREGL